MKSSNGRRSFSLAVVSESVIDASVRDTPQIRKLQFPVFSHGVAPSATINHCRVTGVNVSVTSAGVRVNPGDIVTADEDGAAVVSRAKTKQFGRI
jgi:4-hydroxy-4-methyl-2-oxoglutarate aldolase